MFHEQKRQPLDFQPSESLWWDILIVTNARRVMCEIEVAGPTDLTEKRGSLIQNSSLRRPWEWVFWTKGACDKGWTWRTQADRAWSFTSVVPACGRGEGPGEERGGRREGEKQISKPGSRSRPPSVKGGAELTTHLKNTETLLQYFKQGGDTQTSFSKGPYVHSAVWREPGSLWGSSQLLHTQGEETYRPVSVMLEKIRNTWKSKECTRPL